MIYPSNESASALVYEYKHANESSFTAVVLYVDFVFQTAIYDIKDALYNQLVTTRQAASCSAHSSQVVAYLTSPLLIACGVIGNLIFQHCLHTVNISYNYKEQLSSDFFTFFLQEMVEFQFPMLRNRMNLLNLQPQFACNKYMDFTNKATK